MDSLKSSRAAADHDRDRALTDVATLSGKSGLPEDAGEEVVPDIALARVGIQRVISPLTLNRWRPPE
jgi:hypothetical protein